MPREPISKDIMHFDPPYNTATLLPCYSYKKNTSLSVYCRDKSKLMFKKKSPSHFSFK